MGNIVANELLKTLGFEVSYKWADICADAVLAGMKNVVIPVVSDDASKILKRLNLVYRGVGDCVIGLDIETVDNLFTIRNQEKPIEVLYDVLNQCFTPVIAGGLCDKFLPYLSKKLKFTTKAHSFFKSTKLPDDKIGEAIYNSLDLDVVLKNRNLTARNLYKQVLSSVDGAKAMDILLDAKFDISKLSSKNFERLARIVGKYGDNQADEIVGLFAETTDVNRMLVSMDNMVKTVDDYKKLITAIKNHEQFQGTIKIGQTNYNFEDFFETYSDAFEYYHKEALGVHYFAKVKEGSGYMYVINILEETGPTVQNFFKGFIGARIDEFFEGKDKRQTLDD